MSYNVKFSKTAHKDFSKLDKQTQRLIVAWLDKNLNNCIDPRAHGKALTANFSGKWRYRIGDYRLIAEILDDELIILALSNKA